MKSFSRILLSLLFAAWALPAVCAGQDSRPDEELQGDIAVLGIPVGKGSVQIWNNETWEGHPARRIVAKGETVGLISLFYRVNDTMESFCDPQSSQTYLFRVHFEEGKYRRNQEYRFDQADGMIKGTHGSELKMMPPTYDPLAAIMYIRSADLREGMVLSGNVSDGRQVYRMEAVVPKKEMKSVLGRRMPCWVVEPRMDPVKLGGILNNEKFRKFTAWMTADQERILVLAKGDLFFGALAARLQKREVKPSSK